MEPNIPHSDQRFVFESQIRELYGRAVYTHKTHEKMADKNASLQRRVKWTQIALSALTSSGAVGSIFAETTWLPFFTAIMSLLTLIVSGYAKDIDPGALAQRHRESASDIWSIREGYLSLLSDISDESILLHDLRERRDSIQDRLHIIYRSAPHTDGDAYAAAQKALKENEELTFSDEEIDKFLPAPLRRKV